MRAPVLVLMAVMLFASPAWAHVRIYPEGEAWLSLGPLFSTSFSPDAPGQGIGAEATLNWLEGPGGVGVFGQAQRMTRSSTRVCGGLQGILLVGGLELGLAHETAGRTHIATTSLHVAPYLAFVFGTVGLRFGIPLSNGRGAGPDGMERTRLPLEMGLVLTAKIPIALSKDTIWGPIFPWN
ncbi:hypothetical protein A176_001486 [Myxococcus hansupus]|uniref:Uncharacterized protein n=1 Tax=Pseudomyxococcus hansupus TaxID=1297742 RepID=A0A0H4WP93_9BACT|nr:hypothetical protein [Myxococcus hansupus]AKQ64574.1 hypothetical protein A176_001486 [Myxococcus hansupus]